WGQVNAPQGPDRWRVRRREGRPHQHSDQRRAVDQRLDGRPLTTQQPSREKADQEEQRRLKQQGYSHFQQAAAPFGQEGADAGKVHHGFFSSFTSARSRSSSSPEIVSCCKRWATSP